MLHKSFNCLQITTGVKTKNPVLIFSKRDCLFKDWKSKPTSLPDFPKTVLRFVKTERL